MTRIWYPLQRALRTAVQVFVVLTGMLAAFTVLAPQVIDALADVLGPELVLWLGGFVASAATLSMGLSKLMAIPAVDQFLKKFGLGSEPKTAITYTNAAGESFPMTRRSWRKFVKNGGILEEATPELTDAEVEKALHDAWRNG